MKNQKVPIKEVILSLSKSELILMRHCMGNIYAFKTDYMNDLTISEKSYGELMDGLNDYLTQLKIDIW